MRVICETGRLIVREWTDSPQDVDRAFDTYRREEVTKWLGNPAPLTDPAQAVAGQARRAAMYAEHQGRFGVWAVQVRDSGIVAGSVLLLPMPEPSDGSEGADEVEIGLAGGQVLSHRGCESRAGAWFPARARRNPRDCEAGQCALACCHAPNWDDTFGANQSLVRRRSRAVYDWTPHGWLTSVE